MPLDVPNVTRAIENLYKGKLQTLPTPELIIAEVSRFYSIDKSVLLGTQKNKGTAEARQLAMYLIRKMTNLSYPDIAKEFGKNHTTVLHAIRAVEEKLSVSSNGLQDNIRDIQANINSRL
jgi:chromosomal replication initiator protein